VRAEDRHALPDGAEEYPAGFVAGGEVLKRVENQRVMGKNGLGSGFAGRIESLSGGIEAEEHPVQFGTGVPGLESCIVPLFGQSRGIKGVDQTEQVMDAGDAFFFHTPAGKKRECNPVLVALSVCYVV
jgi:hypothetical protein